MSKSGVTLKTRLGVIQGHIKNTKKVLLNSTLTFRRCAGLLVGNHLFVLFAVLDVSFAVNSCLNRSFFYIILYFVSFARYSNLSVENREIFIPHLYLVPPQGVTPSEFCENV